MKSKSLARVRAVLTETGLPVEILEMAVETRTAEQAANAAGCKIDQIAKSIVFRGDLAGQVVLFITAGGNRVDPAKASVVAGQHLGKADADLIRSQTGFAIGGVAPVGHVTPIRTYFDPKLLEFGRIWAAAGTPRHIFSISPNDLLLLSGAELGHFTI